MDGLVRSARAHSKAMLDADVFSHESPNGEAFDRRIRRFHVARQLGETIAWGSGSYGTPAGIVGMWLKSPPHRAILLDRSFTRVGVGRAFGTFQGVGRGGRVDGRLRVRALSAARFVTRSGGGSPNLPEPSVGEATSLGGRFARRPT